MHDSGNGHVERKQRMGGHEVGVEREQGRGDGAQRAQPRACARPWAAGQHFPCCRLGGSFLTHLGRSTLTALTSAVIVSRLRPTSMLSPYTRTRRFLLTSSLLDLK